MHRIIFLTNEPCMMKGPKEDSLSFTLENFKSPVYFRYTADIESSNSRVECEATDENMVTPKTTKIQNIHHKNRIACGY